MSSKRNNLTSRIARKRQSLDDIERRKEQRRQRSRERVIQVKTMRMLKELDLIQTEDSSWPDEVRRLVRCNCACCQWGLTDLGRDMVATMNVRWSSATEKRIASAYSGRPQYDRVDEDEFPQYGGGDLDYENE